MLNTTKKEIIPSSRQVIIKKLFIEKSTFEAENNMKECAEVIR